MPDENLGIDATVSVELIRKSYNRKMGHHTELFASNIDIANGISKSVVLILHCCEHDTAARTTSRDVGIKALSSPWKWCEKCMSLVKELYPDEYH